MLEKNPFEHEHKLKQQLNSDYVEIPDFPKKASVGSRLLRFLASPAKDPVEAIIGNDVTIVFHASLLGGAILFSVLTIWLATSI